MGQEEAFQAFQASRASQGMEVPRALRRRPLSDDGADLGGAGQSDLAHPGDLQEVDLQKGSQLVDRRPERMGFVHIHKDRETQKEPIDSQAGERHW